MFGLMREKTVRKLVDGISKYYYLKGFEEGYCQEDHAPVGDRERFSEDTRKVTTKEAEEMKYVRVESLRNMIEILKDNGKDLKDLEDLIDDLPQIEIREVKHESSSGYDSSRV